MPGTESREIEAEDPAERCGAASMAATGEAAAMAAAGEAAAAGQSWNGICFCVFFFFVTASVSFLYMGVDSCLFIF